MKKTLTGIIKFFIYATFFVPLAVIPSSFIFPFIVPKILLLRGLVTAMAAGYGLLLILSWQEFRPRVTPITITLGLFVASFLISTFVGVDRYHSFWDNHERMLGLFTILHYFIYFLVVSVVFKNWLDWKWALRIFLLAGSIVMFIGVLQVSSPYLLLNQGQDRVASTLGNAIYVGGYGLFLLFVAFLLLVKESSTPWRIIEALAGFLALLGMFYSGTRGSLVGAAFGAAALVIGYSLMLKERRRLRQFLVGLIALGVVMFGVLYYFRATSFVSRIPAVGRALNTSFTDIKQSARWIAWQIAIQSWKEKPLFGWGPNNFFYAFNIHFNPKSMDFGYGETWFDNAHNIILNTLSVQGAVGLLTYVAIFVVSCVLLARAFHRRQIDYHITLVGIGFLVAHFVQNITVFENPTSYLYFMFWLAFANWAAHLNNLEKNSSRHVTSSRSAGAAASTEHRVGLGAVIGAGVVAFVIIYIFEIQPARANMQTLDVLRLVNSSPATATELMRSTLQFSSPHIDDIRSDIARSSIGVLSQYHDRLGKDKSNAIFDTVYPELEKNTILHPLDIRNQLALANLAQVSASINNNPLLLVQAERWLQDALQKSPRRQQIIYSLTALKLGLNKPQEAIALLEQSLKDNPNVGETNWRLMYAYQITGQTAKVQEILAAARRRPVYFTAQEENIISDVLKIPASVSPKTK